MKERFRKLTSMVTALLLVVSLASCAALKKEEAVRVKCPACGYEFEVPMGGE